jgi:benzoyl-CoA reductase/2-hydroxyglutaryl-CoA dehydratase subunit BcrC/BadD/HgdB
MGINSCFIEFWSGLFSATGSTDPFLEEAEHLGFPADSCGWHRAAIGAAVLGMIPTPDIVISTSSPCIGGVTAIEHLARRSGCPLFVLTIPPDDSERSVRYLADQLRSMADFVTTHTGEMLDEDRLREAMNKTNRAREIAVEVFRLAQSIPSPVKGIDIRSLGLVLPLFFGTDTAIEILKAYHDEFNARVKQGISGVAEERFRLMWLQELIQFKNPLLKMLEKEYQASVVVEELNNVYWEPIDPDDPYIGIARRTIVYPFNGPLDRRLRQIQKLAQAYRIDGAINPCHWGCRQGTGARGLVTSALKELNIPVVNLEVDCADPRNFSERQLRTRLEAFMEVLGNSRQSISMN